MGRQGTNVNIVEVAAAPPTPVGGTFTPGKYILTKYEHYTGVGGTAGTLPDYQNETLVFGNNGTVDAFLEKFSGSPSGPSYSANENRTYALTNGTEISFTVKCPATSVGIAGSYSVQGSDLIIFQGTTRVLTYTHQ